MVALEGLSMQIYICGLCLWPIYFRGGPAHRVYHLGTGWYCWRRQHSADEEPSAPPVGRFEFTTPRKQRQELLEKIISLYSEYSKNDDPRAILAFVRRQFRAKPERGDVVHDLLAYVAGQNDESRDELVAAIVKLPDWQRFAQAPGRWPSH